MTDAHYSKPRRWADIPSDSDEEFKLCPPPLRNLDDSYNGPPASNCGDSNSGLNAALKEKCSATEDRMVPDGAVKGDKILTPDGDEEVVTDSKSTSEPSDFGFLYSTIQSEKSEHEQAMSSDSQYTMTSSASGCFGMFPVASLRSATEFYPTLSSSVIVLDNMKRQLSVCSETGKPKRKHRRKAKKTASSEASKAEDAASLRVKSGPDSAVPQASPSGSGSPEGATTSSEPKARSVAPMKVKKSEKVDRPSTTKAGKKGRSSRRRDEENVNVQPQAPRASAKEEVEVDWEARALQRIREVEKILDSDEYERYMPCALVSDPTQPDPSSRLGKREWKYQLEKWRRCVKWKGRVPGDDDGTVHGSRKRNSTDDAQAPIEVA